MEFICALMSWLKVPSQCCEQSTKARFRHSQNHNGSDSTVNDSTVTVSATHHSRSYPPTHSTQCWSQPK
eukprot:2675787-Amphidinium_carterae.1